MSVRKSFIIHFDSLDVLPELTDEQAGQLFKAMAEYQKTGECKLSGLLNAIFIPFKNQFDRDNEKYKSICERNRNNGLTGGRPVTQKTQSVNLGYSETQSNPKKPDNKNKNKNDSKNNKEDITTPGGVDVCVWSDFLELRKKKRAPITQTAIHGLEKEAAKAGVTLNEAIKICCKRGWKDFEAAWVKPEKEIYFKDGKNLMDFGGNWEAYQEYLKEKGRLTVA